VTHEIFRITPENASCLSQVDPDIFDAEVDLERTFAFLSTPNHVLIVARVGSLVIGQVRAMLHMQPDGPNQLYIDNLGVAPAHQRQGIASALLREVFLWGKANDCLDAWVATEPDNEEAYRLYNRFRKSSVQVMSYFELDLG
jgi:ribosomal protein S18 acetylase RimI-like enzyme